MKGDIFINEKNNYLILNQECTGSLGRTDFISVGRIMGLGSITSNQRRLKVFFNLG